MDPRYRAPSYPHVLCTIGPGKRACGAALWTVTDGKGVLSWSGLVEQKDGSVTKLARQIVGLELPVEGVRIYFIEDPRQPSSGETARTSADAAKKLAKALEYEGARPLLKIKRVSPPRDPDSWERELSRSELKLIPTDPIARCAVELGLFALGRT